jgi:hypothetical protein
MTDGTVCNGNSSHRVLFPSADDLTPSPCGPVCLGLSRLNGRTVTVVGAECGGGAGGTRRGCRRVGRQGHHRVAKRWRRHRFRGWAIRVVGSGDDSGDRSSVSSGGPMVGDGGAPTVRRCGRPTVGGTGGAAGTGRGEGSGIRRPRSVPTAT